MQNQQAQVQGQNQYQNQQQSGQFVSQNQHTNVQYPGSQQGGHQPNYPSQPSGGYVTPVQPTGSYGGQQTTQFVSQQTSNGVTQQTSHFQGQSGNQSVGPGPGTGPQNGSFQISSGHQSGGPGPTCVCQAWTKPQPGVQNDNPSQRNDENEKKPE